jgi:hypothetical protein
LSILPFESLEDLLTNEFGFGLGDKITPVQRSICKVLDYKEIPDDLWSIEDVKDTYHGIRPIPGNCNEIELLCGIRCGKTLICAAAGIWAALSVQTTAENGIHLRAGETPRVSIVSATTDNAEETLKYIVGAFTESPFLSAMLAKKITGSSVLINHPNGHRVEIKVSAMSSRGVNLVSRWCASVIFDEAPRMASEDEGVINLEAQVKAVRMRLLKGAWIMYLGSPVGRTGYVFDLYEANKGNVEQKCIIVQAYSFRMNPEYWTPERCKELEEKDPDTYKTDVLAQFADPEAQFFSHAVIEQCIRKEPLVIPFERGKRYMAVMDPAATTNAWTFCIAESPDNRKFRVVYNAQWQGSQTEPLSPKKILAEILPICQSYEIETIISDQYQAPAIRDLAFDIGLGLSEVTITKINKNKNYLSLLARMEAKEVELPNDKLVKKDFANVKKRYSKGEINIVPIETPDGRHCDYAAMLALLIGRYLDAYEIDKKPVQKTISIHDDPYEMEMMLEEVIDEDMPAYLKRGLKEWYRDD